MGQVGEVLEVRAGQVQIHHQEQGSETESPAEDEGQRGEREGPPSIAEVEGRAEESDRGEEGASRGEPQAAGGERKEGGGGADHQEPQQDQEDEEEAAAD